MLLPPVHSVPLKPNFVEALRANPEVRNLQDLLGTGTGIAIKIEASQQGGWGIQSEFVAKTLRIIFPEIAIVPNVDQASLKLDIVDPGLGHRSPTMLSMPTLKAANPGPNLDGKERLREMMHLPKEAQIASLYISKQVTDVLAPIQTVLGSGSSDIVLVSLQDELLKLGKFEQRLGNEIRRIQNSETSPVHVLLSSEVTSTTFQPGEKYVVINSSRGRMPYIHAASDFVVVVGPANFLEPISAGRPTYFVQQPQWYVPDVWQSMVKQAEATNLGHAYDSLSDLPNLIPITKNLPAGLPLYEVRDEHGQIPLETFISELSRALRAQIFAAKSLNDLPGLKNRLKSMAKSGDLPEKFRTQISALLGKDASLSELANLIPENVDFRRFKSQTTQLNLSGFGKVHAALKNLIRRDLPVSLIQRYDIPSHQIANTRAREKVRQEFLAFIRRLAVTTAMFRVNRSEEFYFRKNPIPATQGDALASENRYWQRVSVLADDEERGLLALAFPGAQIISKPSP